MKILIVEDDPVIRNQLAQLLEQWGYEAIQVKDFQHVVETFTQESPQLVLMDVRLPYFNGYYFTQEIRKQSQVPIIFISSVSESTNMVMALQMGADDYILKPFDPQVTLSKIQALLRRTYDFHQQESLVFFSGEVSLDVGKSVLSYHDQQVNLTFTELQLLRVLFQHPQKFSTREELLDASWKNNQFIDDNTLAVNMSRIRKKAREIGLASFIETKKNYGYRLVEV